MVPDAPRQAPGRHQERRRRLLRQHRGADPIISPSSSTGRSSPASWSRPRTGRPCADFIRAKLTEYQLDEIGIFLDDEELFSYINPNLPLQDYRDLKANIVKRAQLGEDFRSIEPMGSGRDDPPGRVLHRPRRRATSS